jgi:hypothetical protein
MSPELLTILKTLVEQVREGDSIMGEIDLPGPGKDHEWLNVSLARFQSYRGRTTAALLEELEDLCDGASFLEWMVDDGIVRIDVA